MIEDMVASGCGIGIYSGFRCSRGGGAGAPREIPDTMAERMKPCTICHGTEDRAGRDAYYPRIAGKPKGYLFQLRNFRDGRRYYRPMALLLANASDQYLLEMADYFATLKQPYPPPERTALSPGETRLAEKLILRATRRARYHRASSATASS